MKAVVTWIGAAVVILMASPASAQWTEVRSENFVFQGQSDPAAANAVVMELELFRASAMQVMGAEPQSEPVAIRIFAVEPSDEFQSLMPYAGFSVLSHSELDGPVYLVNDISQWTEGSLSRRILLQDYAAHLITAFAPDQYPYWLQSGLADYIACSAMDEGVLTAGKPIEAYDYALSRRNWVPMDTVLGAMTGFYMGTSLDDGLDIEMFQRAQSWAAVNFIMSGAQLASRLPEYLNRLDAGERPDKAFKRAFRMSPKKFEKLLKNRAGAVHAARPVILLGSAAQNSSSAVVVTKILSAPESALAYGDVLRVFANTLAGLEAADQQYSILISSASEWPSALAGKAEVAATLGDFDKSEALIAKALQKFPEDSVALKRAGTLYFARFEATGDSAWLEPARDNFAAALKDLADDPAVNYYYAAICARIDCPLEPAHNAAVMALKYYSDAKYIESNAGLLPNLELSGDVEALETFASFSQIWGSKG